MEEKDKEILLNMVKDRPQQLCKMCGNCCRVVTTRFTYEELLEKQSQGDSAAIDFLSIFVPFETIEDARKESSKIVDNILKRSNLNEKNITFYKCKYLKEDNKCSDYENRPLLCRLNPLSAWSIVPPDCGFKEWLKELKNKKIAQIQHQKNNLKELNELLKIAKTTEQTEEINKRIKRTEDIISFYKKYGANDW